MKKQLYSLAFATLLVATSCSNKDELTNNNPIDNKPGTVAEKEQISFSMSDGQGMVTRAMGVTRAGFTAKTQILMHIESKMADESKWRNTRALAKADSEASGTGYSKVTFDASNTRYWDDAFGRNAELSVYAVAIPKLTPLSDDAGDNKLNESDLVETTGGTNFWTADVTSKPEHKIIWGVSASQTSQVRDDEDLVYSNNIQSTTTEEMTEKYGVYRYNFTNQTDGSWPTYGSPNTFGVMKFTKYSGAPADAPGKFDKGHLIFNHALSRITVTLQEGKGFNTSSNDDFKFTGDNEIVFHKMNTKGTLDLVTGTWSVTTSNVDTKLTTTAANASTTFYGQFLPDKVFRKDAGTAENNVISFSIDNNIYYITEANLYKALSDGVTNSDVRTAAGITTNNVTLKQGKNYVFTIIVDKKEISDVTASVVAWDDITADNINKDNTHYKFTFHEASGTKEAFSNHHLFRKGEPLSQIYTSSDYTADTYQGEYSEMATLSAGTADNVWSTNWYYEDNKTAYHFRVINDKAYGSSGDNYTGESNAKFNMVNGAQNTQDYHWGAPLDGNKITGESPNYKYKYSTTDGYKDLLMQGIMSTKSQINLTEFHMMSNINIVVRTTNESNAVKLINGDNKTKVFITKVYTDATVDMGIGKVSTTGDRNSDTAIEIGQTGANQITTPTYTELTNDGTVTIDSKSYTAMKTPAYTWAVVPQTLVDGDETRVGLIIQTPDDNKYYVVKDLANIMPTSVGNSANQTTSSAIMYWYPNHKYTYTITITKKGIEAITCSLADWVDVTGTNQNINLEN